jgi:hypothetical protein
MTHILVATDAWHPQVRGGSTLTMMAEAAKGFGVEVPDAAIVLHCDAELS